MYESDIELWFHCHRERDSDETIQAHIGTTSGHHHAIYETFDDMVDFSTVIKSTLSAPEVLTIYNKNVKKADLSWVEEEIEEASIEDIKTEKNFDWLEILLMTIFIVLGIV